MNQEEGSGPADILFFMKKLLLIILFSMAGLYAGAQCTEPYRPFSEFANDTTAFLRYNFNTRSACYAGKTVAEVLKDLQLSPKRFVPKSSTRVNKYAGICIYLDSTSFYDVAQNPGRKTQIIYIYWPDLMDSREVTILIRTAYKDYGDTWIPQYYDFFKDIIVGEVKYYK
jgi:hypothetical protein